ncbi:MAG: hypothetical protein V1904_05225 [Bacteroidota bacterium]
MRTINLLLFAAIIMLFISSCGSKSGNSSDKLSFSSAVDYNNFIIGQQENIVNKMNELSEAIDAENYTDATTKQEELVKQCKSGIDSVKALDAYNGNTAFRDEAVTLFNFYKEISEKEYKEMLDILKKENIAETDIQRMEEIRQDISKRENERDEAFGKAQKTFYKENDIDS